MNHKNAQVTKARPFFILLTCLITYFTLIKVALVLSIALFLPFLKKEVGSLCAET